jgi:hypothetical protein
VISSPLPPLIHRYSFNETSGTTAHDSVGGADGTVHGSAVFDGNGRVVLNGTSGTYVALPGNLLAGLTNVAIETWVTNATSPDNVALFSFDDGLQDGVGGGYLRFVLHDQSNGRNFLELASSGGSPKLTANPGLGGRYVHVVCNYGLSTTWTYRPPRPGLAVSFGLTVCPCCLQLRSFDRHCGDLYQRRFGGDLGRINAALQCEQQFRRAGPLAVERRPVAEWRD